MALTAFYLNIIICILILIYQWRQNKSVIYLFFIIILVNIRQLNLLLLNQVTNTKALALILIHLDPLMVFIGPLIYLYFRSLIEGKLVIEKRLAYFLLPAGVIFINSFPFYLEDFETKIAYAKAIQHSFNIRIIPGGTLLFDFKFQRFIIPIINWSVLTYTLIFLIKQKKIKSLKLKIENLINKLMWILAIVVLPGIIQVMYASINSPFQFDMAFKSKSITPEYTYLMTLTLPLSFFLFPTWLYGGNPSASIWDKFKEIVRAITRIAHENKQVKTEKSEDLVRILQYIDSKKPYLSENFSVHDVSRELNIPHLRVSNCFNKQLEITFPEYRNQLRIAHAVSLLKDNAHFQMSIEGIGKQCGFKNKSSFYAAFRAVHQMTPTEWISKNLG